MQEIYYIAKLTNGALIEGSMEGVGAEALAGRLRECGLELVKIKEKRVFFTFRARSLGDREASSLARDLATIITTGVSLSDGLRDLAAHSPPKRKLVFISIAKDVEGGVGLADALDARGGIFTNEFVAAVRAGERSGCLDKTLERLADALEWRANLRAQMIQALAYPVGLIVAACGLVALVALYLVPRLAGPLLKMGGELPAVTKFVIGASDLAGSHGIVILGNVALFVVTILFARTTRSGGLIIDGLLLRIPLVGAFLLKAAGADFASALGTLYRAGLPLNESLQLIEDATKNAAVRDRVHSVREAVITGASLAESSNRFLQFPPLVGRLLAIGEKTGTLDQSLDRISQQLEREVKASAKRFVTIAEPAAILVAGAGVGTAIFAAILPLFRMLEAVRR